MSDRLEKAMRLADLQRHPGWRDLMAIANEQMGQNFDWILETMSKSPDKLTGKTAIAKANRHKGVKNLLDAVGDEVRFLNSSTQTGQE